MRVRDERGTLQARHCCTSDRHYRRRSCFLNNQIQQEALLTVSSIPIVISKFLVGNFFWRNEEVQEESRHRTLFVLHLFSLRIMSTTGKQRHDIQVSLHDSLRPPPWVVCIPRGVHEAVPGPHSPEGVPVPGPQRLFKRRCGNCLICLERDLQRGIWLFPREAHASAPSTQEMASSKNAPSTQETASKDAPSTQDTVPSKDAPSTQGTTSKNAPSTQETASKDAPSTEGASSKEPPATQRKDSKDVSTIATQQPAPQNTPPTVLVQTVLVSKEQEISDWSNRFLDVMEQIKLGASLLEELAGTNWRAPGLPGGTELVAAQTDVENSVQDALRMLREFDFGGEMVVLRGSGAGSSDGAGLAGKEMVPASSMAGGRNSSGGRSEKSCRSYELPLHDIQKSAYCVAQTTNRYCPMLFHNTENRVSFQRRNDPTQNKIHSDGNSSRSQVLLRANFCSRSSPQSGCSARWGIPVALAQRHCRTCAISSATSTGFAMPNTTAPTKR